MFYGCDSFPIIVDIKYSMKRFGLLLMVIFCFTAFAAHAQKKAQPELYDLTEVDKRLDAAKKELGGGAVLMIYKDGKIVHKKEVGPDFGIRTPVPIGASSQWLTAALVMTFVDEGKLSLDDKVSQYLPIFKTYGKAYITIRNCLNNFTGIENPSGIGTFFEKKYPTLEELVNSYANKHEIQTNPGTEFRYSPIGINIVGRICETLVKNKAFDRLILERVCRPLGMHNTSFYSEKALLPSSGAISSASDYINFLAMMMNKGMFNGKQVLSEKSVAEMQKIQTTPELIKYAPDAAKGYSFGLGEWIQDVDSQGNPAVISCPNFSGTLPYVDFCHGYACIFLVKNALSDTKREVYNRLKDMIDGAVGGECK